MSKRTWLQAAAFIGASLSIVACGSTLKTVQPTVTPTYGPPEVVASVAAPVQDPVTLLIAQSQEHFVDGEHELTLGHLEQAKKEFDRAVDVLLQSPDGARSEPRIRDHFDRLVERGSRYLPMIQDEFRRAGLPLDLAYVPLIESAFKTNAQSRAKAKGMWQFMRSTGLEHGLQQNWYLDERSDPEKATKAAAKYLKT